MSDRLPLIRGLICALLAAPLLAASPAGARDAVAAGAGWIAAQQRSNGAFFADDYPAQDVAETITSIVAGGVTGAPVDRALSFVAAHGPAAATEAAYAARIVLGLVSAGRNPRTFGGYDYVARLESFYSPATGAYDTRLYADAISILGVVAAKHPVPKQAITYLRANQCTNGGFGHDAACASKADTDTTAMVMIALARAGVSSGDAVRSNARAWLRSAQNGDGGFPLSAGGSSNANSTGLVLSALAAIGEQPAAWRSATGSSPLTALLKLQLSNGGFAYLPGQTKPNAYATVQAVPGVAGVAFPILPRAAVKGSRVTVSPRQSTRGAAVESGAPSMASTSSAAPARDPFAPPARTVVSGSTLPAPKARSAATVWLAAVLALASAGLIGVRRLRR